MRASSLADAVSAFGAALKSKLSNAGASGAPEDQLRGPLDDLMKDLARLVGLPEGAVELVGESTLAHLKTRPDFAVTVHGALVGFVEVKAPGKGADPRRFTDEHDKRQWGKLRSLPNLLYTDGAAFTLWRDGEREGAVALEGDPESAGARLAAPDTLLPLVSDFLRWQPLPPRTARQLAETAARLCRLLRDEVTEELAAGNPGLTSLAGEWRALLFPHASDAEFADGYAQAVTFGLLVARARGIELKDGIGKAAIDLRSTNSLIATALRLLTDDPRIQDALETSTRTLTRVLDAVDWPALTKGDADAWIYFYEHFLEVYDNALRKRTGSYYTPPEVVTAMVRLGDEALRDPALFGRPQGLASRDVTLADPAVGTGAYLLGALRRIAQTVEADLGPGAVPGAIASATERLVGFEMQFGSFAVAQLRLIAEIQTLMSVADGDGRNLPALRLFVTDTLGDPYAAQTQFSGMVAPIGESRREANAIKRGEPITVVIGNPPYKDKAKGLGGWIEAGSDGRVAAMDLWRPPREWGVGGTTYVLKNLYVYFWRWATWKVFGSGHAATTGEAEGERAGIICFITASGFLNGPGFQKMRDDLRRDCSHIWVIDCSPEGHQPDVPTRIFQGVQQPVCIVLAVRVPGTSRDTPAFVQYCALPPGRREEKFQSLARLSLQPNYWIEALPGWRDSFLATSKGLWFHFSSLDDLFAYSGRGIEVGRTWVIAPDRQSLLKRWQKLLAEKDPVRKEILFHPHLRPQRLGDKHISKVVARPLPGRTQRAATILDEGGPCPNPERYSFRTLDRQWVIPDARLINQPNPTLWEAHSKEQIHLTALLRASPSSGPAISFAGELPDLERNPIKLHRSLRR